MSNGERDNVRSLRFTQGKPAEISAGFDRSVSRVQEFIEKKVFGSTRKNLINIQTDNFRYEIHKRDLGYTHFGQWVDKQLPDGTTSRMVTADIVHVYSRGANNQEQLVERKRVKDNPLGFSNAARRG